MLHSRTIWIISNLFLAGVQIVTYCKAGVLAIKKQTAQNWRVCAEPAVDGV